MNQVTDHEVLKAVGECGVIAIIRRLSPDRAEKVAETLSSAGAPVFEVTIDSEDAAGVIRRMSRALEGKVFVGAGTVLDAAAAREAVAAGAQFIVAPNFNPEVVETALRYGKVAIPGVFTPSEIVAAVQAGAQAVKVFPAGILGPEYIRQVKAPLPYVRMVAVGGVSARNAADFIRAGAFALGVGGNLVDAKAIREERYDLIAAAAQELIAAVRAGRG
ncbi:MAG: bifunctional 4-hydroxy-2-oxoglutarate aldolase/2-dehydro-3-deoxy-phosphogluconate aldolase [Firmicutes bacterium]|nr:bifunctional 4-hydroxy-2-oxoglutarate aldolase/2-dehydro-3-deoxy-phosphogluconate aldolase [Bacillota bacterium]